MKRSIFAALAMLGAASALSPAQALVIGTADAGNAMPFGGNGGGYYFQQIFDAASFGAGLTITDLSFYTSLYPDGAVRSGTFVIYLSTIDGVDIGTFDTSNSIPWLDASFTEVFNGELPALANERLDLHLAQAFDYDPSQGDLLLTVREFSLSSGTAFFDVDEDATLTNSRFSAYPYDWNQGLVTGFNDVAAPAVPEPASWALMIGGFALAGMAMRTRRATVRFA